MPTPGTPVQLIATTTACSKIRLQAAGYQNGNVYVGVASMNKNTLAGVIKVFAPNLGATPSDELEIATNDGADGLYVNQYYVDADNAGYGVLAAYWVS